MAGAWGLLNPLEFPGEGLLALGFRFFLKLKSLPLLVEPARVVALPGHPVTTVELKDPLCYVVEEVTVVGNADNGSRVLLQVPLKPCH